MTEQQERAYQAHRAAHLARLTGHGVAPVTAEAVLAAWEREAAARGRDRGSEAFWEGAEDWIVEHRAGHDTDRHPGPAAGA